MFQVIAVLFGLTFSAQPQQCPADSIVDATARIYEVLDTADVEPSLAPLLEVKSIIATLEASCNGLSFSGASEGQTNVVIGPVAFENRNYVATVTTDGYIVIKMTTVSGTCDLPFSLFNLSAHDATNGAQTVFAPGGDCTVLIEVSNTTLPWTLTFEPVAAGA
jgi:hypothetical protein